MENMVRIVNTEQLARGLGAPYLEVIHGENGDYVAKQWRRKIPQGGRIIASGGPFAVIIVDSVV